MHKGRLYPQTKHRWKFPDCGTDAFLPRQLQMFLVRYHPVGRNDVYVSASYPATDDPSTLIERYTFPILTLEGVDLTVTCTFDGTNDLDSRGRKVRYDGSDGSYEEYFDISPWDNQQGCTTPMFEQYDIWAPVSRTFGPGGPGFQQIDWYAYPATPGWSLMPFYAGDAPGRYPYDATLRALFTRAPDSPRSPKPPRRKRKG